MQMNKTVAIMGGGLAGLSLAIELKQKHPNLSITVLERNKHPVAHATHKVGESTVEIGAHYFATVLGLKQHLDQQQLKKFGFRFFFSDKTDSIDTVTELGGSMVLPTGAYQIDRGVFENFLGEHARKLGVVFVDGAVIRRFTLSEESGGSANHIVEYQHEGILHLLKSDWLIDAAGRVGLIKRKLHLAEANEHNANAVWFRVSNKIDVDTWSNDSVWLNRCNPPNRWLSTNHLVGNGYWVWLIPLASGSHSVGIVCDGDTHPIDTMSTFEKAMDWFAVHQPRLYAELDGQRHLIQDFNLLKHFSYGCKQVYSGTGRWALTGEAGVFLDPFYSPGSDFIAISNGFITQLITLDIEDKRLGAHAEIYQKIYLNFYKNMLPIYLNQYKLFADPVILPIKLSWDYAFYWALMCQMYVQNKLTDLPTMLAVAPVLERAQAINRIMQQLFSDWGDLNSVKNSAIMLDQAKLNWLYQLNHAMGETWEAAEFVARMKKAEALLDVLAAQITMFAQKKCLTLPVDSITKALADSGANPFSKEHDSLLFPALLNSVEGEA
jgi:flavin-dependent dehydrogenase